MGLKGKNQSDENSRRYYQKAPVTGRNIARAGFVPKLIIYFPEERSQYG